MSETASELDPHKYRCIRCKAPADVIFKGMLPYCFPHEPAESRAARLPKEEEPMSDCAKTTNACEVPIEPVTAIPGGSETKKPIAVGGGWVVNAKDGSELHNGFASKKEASKWASLEVENKRLKAGQYKIAKIS